MASYSYRYVLSEEKAKLLRDLVVYQISLYDSKLAAGENGPFLARRADALGLLRRVNSLYIIGSDSTAILFWDIVKLCKPVADEIREKFKRTTLQFGDDDGLNGILCMYSNELIAELKETISGHNRNFERGPFDCCFEVTNKLSY